MGRRCKSAGRSALKPIKMNQEKRLTKVEIIQSIIGIYIKDPSKRGIEKDGTCVFSTEDGRHCAVGQCLLDSIKSAGNEWDLSEESAPGLERIVTGGLDTVLQPKYRGHELSFWCDVQNLHDNTGNWEETGMTLMGLKNYANLIKKYT